MSVNVIRTEAFRAEITWEGADDIQGYLVQAIDSERLAYALESLGSSSRTEPTATEESALAMAAATANIAQLLQRRTATQVVRLRDDYGLSWRALAVHLFDDADKQSSVRRMYDSGRRHLGL